MARCNVQGIDGHGDLVVKVARWRADRYKGWLSRHRESR